MTTARHAQEKATVKRSITLSAIRENVPVLALAGIAFGASYGHIVKLFGDHGPHGWVQYAGAATVDLLCIIAAEERQRDKRISRPRRGKFVTWSAVVLIIGIAATLIANLATADPGPLGICVAAWPAAALLLAVSVLERRASFEAPAGTRTARRRSRAAGTEPAAVAPEPVPAASTAVPVQEAAQDDAAMAERTPEILLAEARAYRDELASAGERVSKDKLRLRLAVGSKKALELLQALKEDDQDDTREAVV